MPTLRSTDDLIYAAQMYGMLRRDWIDTTSNVSSASATCGSVTGGRLSKTFTIPSMGSGIAGCYVTSFMMYSASGGVKGIIGLEYVLGTLTATGNVFAGGVAMPIKQGVQTIATMVVVCVETLTLTATTPVLTITYTNQDGTMGRIATLTLPTNPGVSTVFFVGPHLQAGDTGVRAVTNLSLAPSGTGAVLRVRGVLPVAQMQLSNPAWPIQVSPLEVLTPAWLCEPGDSLGVYRIYTGAGGSSVFVHFSAVAER